MILKTVWRSKPFPSKGGPARLACLLTIFAGLRGSKSWRSSIAYHHRTIGQILVLVFLSISKLYVSQTSFEFMIARCMSD